MLSAQLEGTTYSKADHRRQLVRNLQGRSEASIEFKHGNISAVLIELGFPYIDGYKPRSNYQSLLFDVIAERVTQDSHLQEAASVDADRPSKTPTIEDILSILVEPPTIAPPDRATGERPPLRLPIAINYLEREARNSSLGRAGEEFVMDYERARLIRSGNSKLADRIEHISRSRGDAEGFDILSFEENGKDRLIEVKTTKYGQETPFFLSRNELTVSEVQKDHYHLYRLFRFSQMPRLFVLNGALSAACTLVPTTFVASVRRAG